MLNIRVPFYINENRYLWPLGQSFKRAATPPQANVKMARSLQQEHDPEQFTRENSDRRIQLLDSALRFSLHSHPWLILIR